MINLDGFKSYCGYLKDGQDATKSDGVVTIRREDSQSQSIITIPVNTVFSVATGQSFQNLEMAEINESRTFIPLPLESLTTGYAQNIPADSEWSVGISGITVMNAQAFSGGKDEIPKTIGVNVAEAQDRINDSILQLILSHSEQICRQMIGNPSVSPKTASFELAVYFLGRYYVESRSKDGYKLDFDLTIFTDSKSRAGIKGMKIHKGVMRILTGMLTPDRSPTDFMPEVSSVTS